MRRIKTLAIYGLGALLLFGCTNSTYVPEIFTVDKPVYHPNWPQAYRVCNISWEAKGDIESDDPAEVSTTWEGNVTAAKCHNELVQYIKQLNKMVCEYRKELEEERCNAASKK